MSMRLRYDAPNWIKFVLTVFLIAFFCMGFPSFSMEMTIYGNAPHEPDLATGRTHLVKVMHGSSRYVTALEESKFIFWDEIGPLSVIPLFLCILIVALNRAPES